MSAPQKITISASPVFPVPGALPAHYRLPRRKAPALLILCTTLLTLVAAAQFYRAEPVVAALPVPVAAPPLPAPASIIDKPSLQDEIAHIAGLMPEAVAAPLPVGRNSKYTETQQTNTRPQIKIREVKVETPSTLARQAIALARQGYGDAALDLFQQAHEKAPEDATILYNIALLYEKMVEPQKAAQYYRAALRARQNSSLLNHKMLNQRINELEHS